jgi:hypothetical protein
MQMTSLDPFDLPLPPVVTLAVLVLGYVQSRIIRRGKPLSSLFYGPVFTLGMTYAMAFHGQLAALFHWENAWIAVMVAWGALLAAIAWTRYRNPGQQPLPPQE